MFNLRFVDSIQNLHNIRVAHGEYRFFVFTFSLHFMLIAVFTQWILVLWEFWIIFQNLFPLEYSDVIFFLHPIRIVWNLNWLFAIILAAEGMGIKCPSLFRYKWLALTFTWQLELSRCSLSHSANNPKMKFSLFHLYRCTLRQIFWTGNFFVPEMGIKKCLWALNMQAVGSYVTNYVAQWDICAEMRHFSMIFSCCRRIHRCSAGTGSEFGASIFLLCNIYVKSSSITFTLQHYKVAVSFELNVCWFIKNWMVVNTLCVFFAPVMYQKWQI